MTVTIQWTLKIRISLVHPREIPASTDFTTAFTGLIRKGPCHSKKKKCATDLPVSSSKRMRLLNSKSHYLFNPWYDSTIYGHPKVSQCHQEYRCNRQHIMVSFATQQWPWKGWIKTSKCDNELCFSLAIEQYNSCTLKDQKVSFLLEVQETKMYTFHSLRTYFLAAFWIIQASSWATQLHSKGRLCRTALIDSSFALFKVTLLAYTEISLEVLLSFARFLAILK